MSEKLDARGDFIGSYEIDDLDSFMWPEEKKKRVRSVKLRRLDYDLIWDITEMQVKTFVRAVFPSPIGPLTMQLAKERPLRYEKAFGESRSHALVKDIQISADAPNATPVPVPAAAINKSRRKVRNAEEPTEDLQDLDDILGPSGRQLVNDLASEYQREMAAQMTAATHTAQPVAQMVTFRQPLQFKHITEPIGVPGPSKTVSNLSSSSLDDSSPVIQNQILLEHTDD